MNCFFTSTMDDFFFLIVQTGVGESLARYWEGLPVCHSLKGCGVFGAILTMPLSLSVYMDKLKIRKWTRRSFRLVI